jgi:hypothetical protein
MQIKGGLIPRLCLNSFSPMMQGTTEPEKCRAVLDLSRKIFTLPPLLICANLFMFGMNDACKLPL